MGTPTLIRFFKRLPLCAATLIALSMPAGLQAQTDAVWSGGSGFYNDGALWLPTGEPNGLFNVFIDDGNATNSIVTIPNNDSVTIDSLTIDLGDELIINNNSTLTIVTDAGRPASGMINNDGTITATNIGNNTQIVANGDLMLNGMGQLILQGSSQNSRLAGVGHLFNNGNLISGAGKIGVNQLQFTNMATGTLEADQAGRSLELDPPVAGFTNLGVIRSSNGGDISMLAGSYDNTSGIIEALDMSTVTLFSNVDLTGGVLDSNGSGFIQLANNQSATASNLTNQSDFVAQNNSDLFTSGTIQNQGSITLTNVGNPTEWKVDVATNLTGGGTVTLTGISDNSQFNDPGGSDGVLTNVDNLIQGFGRIGSNNLHFINEPMGLVDANDPGGATMTLDPRSTDAMINRGTLRASNGGRLLITGGALDNDGGNIEAADGSTVDLNNASVTGGMLESFGTGVVETSFSGALLEDLTIDADFISSNNTRLSLNGAIENLGSISIQNLGNLTDINVENTAQLTGGGTISLGGSSANSRITDVPNDTGVLTNVDNTIEGQGQIGANRLQMVNEAMGLVDANEPGGTMTMDPNAAPMINRGTLQASNGGELILTAGEFNNDMGTIQALDGSTVTLQGSASVANGTLQSSGTGIVELEANNTASLTDLVLDADFIARNNTNLFLTGTIENQNSMQLINVGNATYLYVDAAASLTGGGTLVLGGSSDNSRLADSAGSDGVLTNVDNTIQGKGQVGSNNLLVINEAAGVIDANDSSGTLTLDPRADAMQNRGLMKASSGGTLGLANGTYDNANGTIRAEDASTVLLTGGSQVIDGTLESTGSGLIVIPVNQSTELQDVTLNGIVQQQNNSDLTLTGSIANQGEINVTSVGNTTSVVPNGSVTITGPGSLNLQASTTRLFGAGDIEFVGGRLTGIGSVEVPVVFNDATIAPGNSPGLLTFNDSVLMLNESKLQLEVQGVSPNDYDRIDVNDTISLAGDLVVEVSGFVPDEMDTFTVVDAVNLNGFFDNAPNGGTVVTSNRKAVFQVNYGAGSAFNPNQVVLSDYRAAVFAPTEFTVVRGVSSGGGLPEILDSDNADATVQRNPSQTTGVVEVEIKSISPVANPTELEFTLESSGFFRTPVIQSIQLYDYDADAYVEFDSRNTSRFVDDVAVAVATGDLSRFVEDGTGCVMARVVYTSPVRRQSFSVAIDQGFWFIR